MGMRFSLMNSMIEINSSGLSSLVIDRIVSSIVSINNLILS